MLNGMVVLQEDIFMGILIRMWEIKSLKKLKCQLFVIMQLFNQEIVLFQCSWTLSVERYPRARIRITSIGGVEPLTEHDLVIALDHSDSSHFFKSFC